MTEGQIALGIAVISVVVAMYAALISRKQTQQAEKDFQLASQSSKSDAVLHFTDRFFELLKDVESGHIESHMLKHRQWAYQFWSLQSTEFYFFHHGILPTFMYSLWMVDLADLYAGDTGEKIRSAHIEYLNQYSLNYDAMTIFFENLFQLARKYDNKTQRNQEIAHWLKTWITTNQQKVIQ